MKKFLTANLVLAAALLCGAQAWAQPFTLDSVTLGDLKGYAPGAFPEPSKSGPVKPPTDDEDVLIGVDMTIRIPFGAVKKAMLNVSATNESIALIDPKLPILVRSGEFLKVVNLRVDVGGIKVEPVLTLKPYFEEKDKLAVKIQRVKLHVAAAPDVKSGEEPAFDKDEMMAKVMDTVMAGIMTALDKTLKEKNLKFTAAEVLKMSYERDTWILHAELSMKFLKLYLPQGLVGDFHLNAFTFNDKKIFIQFGTDY